MAAPQPKLFEDGDAPARPADRRIVVRAQPGQALSRKQKQFNKLITRVEGLRAQMDDLRRRLDGALVFHAAHVQPRVLRLTALRKDVVRALRPFLDDRRLKRGDKQMLGTIVSELLDAVFVAEGPIDEEMRAVFEQVHGADIAQLERAEMDVARSSMEAMFADLGIDVDLSDFHSRMSEEEIASKAAVMFDDIRRQAEERQAGGQSDRRKTKRQIKEEERARLAEELRKRTIGGIYRQLAKLLHPDLEPDGEARQRKIALMQELTVAYAANDLHTLLRLELEWIHGEQDDVMRLTDEKLDAYVQLLREQAAELEAALSELPYHPRYQPLMSQDEPFGPRPQLDGPAQVAALDYLIASIEGALTRLQSDDPLKEVRGAIQVRRAVARQRY